MWKALGGYSLFLANAIFSKGIPDSYSIETSTGNIGGRVILNNDQLIVTDPLPSNAPLGIHDLYLFGVNGGQNIGQVEILRDANFLDAGGSEAVESYTLLILPNIYLLRSGQSRRDEMYGDIVKYNSLVIDCLRSLLFQNEDLLIQKSIFSQFRLCIATNNIAPTTAFVEEKSPNIAIPIRSNMSNHARKLGLAPDVIFALHGSLNNTRASARYSIDDRSSSVLAFNYDGQIFSHGKFTSRAGVATIGYYSFDTSHTPLHEFGHAAAEESNGCVTDLYHDYKNSSRFDVNKKKTSRNRPNHFAIYNGENYLTDHSRDGIGYDNNWSSYHPELIDPALPNIMDNYWLASSDPLDCKFDKLTKTWFRDRLNFKCNRHGGTPTT